MYITKQNGEHISGIDLKRIHFKSYQEMHAPLAKVVLKQSFKTTKRSGQMLCLNLPFCVYLHVS